MDAALHSEIRSTPSAHDRPAAFDAQRVRRDFPVLDQQVHGKPLVYLDSAATSQKPRAVLDAVRDYYTRDNANIHRGVHALSERATAAYEAARGKVRRMLGAAEDGEIVFTRGATESINLVAQTWGRANLRPGDEILVTGLEHHANIVPWQMLCEQTGAVLRVAPVRDDGDVPLEAIEKNFSDRTRLLSIAHVSNALGTVLPAREAVRLAHERGAVALIDGAQAVPHGRVDVRELGCDFYVFSGHKTYGPTGIGALYGRAELLDSMPPYQGGGDMIRTVTFAKTTYAAPPHRFEAGTPNIAGAVGLGAAADYLAAMELDAAVRYEHELLVYGTALLESIDEVRLIGTAPEKIGVLSFVIEGVHAHDAGTILDHEFGLAVRAGHHCAQPVMDRFGVPGTLRASLAFYNTKEELDVLARGVERAIEIFC